MTNNSSTILEEAREFASKILKNEVSSKMAYHNYDHTFHVVNMAAEISDEMGITAEEREIVLLAAWFHDLGYSKGGHRHEEESKAMAVKFLEERNYAREKIDKVAGCIMATQMPQNPQDRLEQILCDSDLSHLGGDDYLNKSELLREEIEQVKGQKLDKLAWLSINKAFLEGHCFFTKYAKSFLANGITKNLRLVEDEIRRASNSTERERELLAEIDRLKGELAVNKQKKKVKKKKPSRGIETMFRLTSKNHIDLSSMADTKANIMISINAIILSVVVSLLVRNLEEYPHLTIPSLILTSVCLITIVFAILATRPNVPQGNFTREDIDKRSTNLLFFGNFHAAKLEDYEYGMREMMNDGEYLYSNLIRDIYHLGTVLGKKYRLLRICYTIFMFGFVISVLSFIIAEAFYSAPYPY
jgi:predicted metal-dependent HD superfamily phosphohydrolase